MQMQIIRGIFIIYMGLCNCSTFWHSHFFSFIHVDIYWTISAIHKQLMYSQLYYVYKIKYIYLHVDKTTSKWTREGGREWKNSVHRNTRIQFSTLTNDSYYTIWMVNGVKNEIEHLFLSRKKTQPFFQQLIWPFWRTVCTPLKIHCVLNSCSHIKIIN